jgi:hypothetical protein
MDDSRFGREGWSWYDYLLLPIGLFGYVLGIFVPWFRSLGLLKLFGIFMGIWIVFGCVVAITHQDYNQYNTYSRDDFARHSDGWIIPWHYCVGEGSLGYGRWPLEIPFAIEVGCAGWIGTHQLRSIGLDDQAHWLTTQVLYARYDMGHLGTFSVTYIWIGLIFFASLVLMPLWAVWIVVSTLFSHLRIGWK